MKTFWNKIGLKFRIDDKLDQTILIRVENNFNLTLKNQSPFQVKKIVGKRRLKDRVSFSYKTFQRKTWVSLAVE